MITNKDVLEKDNSVNSKDEIRNIAGFWLLGLTNDFAFTVMLSAAHDLLTPDENINAEPANRTEYLLKNCNPIGTGAVLLADTLPEVIVKITSPFFIYFLAYKFKVGLTIFLIQLGIILVSVAGSEIVWLCIIGVALASAGTGVGEVVFLGMSSFFNKECVSSWCSGTGAAGLAGALLYAGFTACGVSPKTSIMLMTVGPFFMIASYLLLIEPVEIRKEGYVLASYSLVKDSEDEEERKCVITPISNKTSDAKDLSCKEKLVIIRQLSLLIIWFALTYFFMYFTNQVLFELMSFENIWLGITQQYRWYQVTCQLGIFIARSSVNIFYTSETWIFVLVELIIFLIMLSNALLQFLPSIWFVFGLIMLEGLAAGASYVNTYYAVTLTMDQKNLEYAMVITCIADSAGTVLAGAVAIPFHNFICNL